MTTLNPLFIYYNEKSKEYNKFYHSELHKHEDIRSSDDWKLISIIDPNQENERIDRINEIKSRR